MASEKHCGSLTRAAFAVLLACGSFAALAQGYPAKPIEVTVHTSAGSGGDIFRARSPRSFVVKSCCRNRCRW